MMRRAVLIGGAVAAGLALAVGLWLWWREILSTWPWFLAFVLVCEVGAHVQEHPRTPLLRLAAALQILSAACRAFSRGQRVAITYAREEFPRVLQSFRGEHPEGPPRRDTSGAAPAAAPAFLVPPRGCV